MNWMDKENTRLLTLGVSASKSYLPVVTSFVESAASAFGMKKDDYLRLSLAAEEIFLYLGEYVCPDKSLEVQCENGLYYTRVAFYFSASRLNLSGLNIASVAVHEGDADLEAMGLLIASRSVDHLHVTVEKNNRIVLSVTKEKSYPAYEEKLPAPGPAEKLVTETPDTEKLKVFAAMTAQYYAPIRRPSFFSRPGKLVDMVHSGQYGAIIALNEKRDIAGGILLCFRTEKIVQIFGPYCFLKEQQRAVDEALLDACIHRIARTKALGLFSLRGLPETLSNHFERLGTLRFSQAGQPPVSEASFYRLLHEDPGFEVWSAAALKDYLERQYHQLALARIIKTSRDMGETRSGASLFSAEIHRDQASVTLRPLLAGNDYAENIERHLRFLRDDHFVNIHVELDMGIPCHADMIDALLASRFRPGILLPFAGKADLMILQYDDETES